MNKKLLSGILFSSAGSFWWGVIAVFYFKYVSFVGTLEIVVHRTIWTAFVLFLFIIFNSRWNFFFEVLYNKKKLFILLICGFLIFINWCTWIYAVVTNRLIDASFGYYIFPILSVLFGFFFFNEKLNKKRIISIILILISIIYFLFIFKSIPWIGLTVAITWSTYNLLRKKINVRTDIDIGLPTVLRKYQIRLHRVAIPIYLSTNGIVGLYTSTSASAIIARHVILRAVNFIKPIKQTFLEVLKK